MGNGVDIAEPVLALQEAVLIAEGDCAAAVEQETVSLGGASLEGWNSESDEEATHMAFAEVAPACSLAANPLLVGRRPPLRFRNGVPRLGLPPPGVGTVGGPFEDADANAGAAAPRGLGVATDQGGMAASGSLAETATFPIGNIPRSAGPIP